MKTGLTCAVLAILILCGLIVLQQRYINHLENIVDTAVSGSVALPAAVSCGPST